MRILSPKLDVTAIVAAFRIEGKAVKTTTEEFRWEWSTGCNVKERLSMIHFSLEVQGEEGRRGA